MPDLVATSPADYRQHLARSHTVEARLLASINGSPFTVPVPLVSGAVDVAPGTGVARSLKAVVRVEPDDVRVDPYATEWQAQYGIGTASGTVWVPVGTFVLVDVEQEGPGASSVTAKDRWLRVADARFERARSTSGDTVAAIRTLLLEADARVTVDTSRAPAGSHRTSVWERDRDKAVADLARSIGARVRFSPSGVAVVEPVPSLGDAPFWAIARGRGGAKIASRGGMTTRRTYNAVVVVSERPGADPVVGIARDTAPASRTRYGGLAAKRPRFYTTDLIDSQAQADAAAAGLLAASLRVSRTLTVDALPHPGLDSGHVLDVETRAGRWERHLAGAFSLPLGIGPVSIATATTATDEDDDGQ